MAVDAHKRTFDILSEQLNPFGLRVTTITDPLRLQRIYGKLRSIIIRIAGHS